MSDESDFSYFRVRLPNALKALIEEASYTSKRSMNAEVISRLEASFGQIEKPFTDAQEAVVTQMVKDYHDRSWADIQKKMKTLEAKYKEVYEEKPPAPPGWKRGDPVP